MPQEELNAYLSIHSNLALACLRTHKHKETLTHCDLVLKHAPKNAKIWFRKGTALQQLGDCQDAVTCYEQALACEPNDTQIQQALKHARAEVSRVKEREKKMFGGMFFK
eukprot:GDKI01021509.1.p2 GENE.GDKI01021509.1~~GDKI01021509.1.p2  ORF type:complete len:109 (+),score=28.69 GDKI01021509.1:730-1056(+)